MTAPLEQLLRELEGYIPHQAHQDTAVSGGSVGWHIEHCLLTIDAVAQGLLRSQPEAYRSRFDLRRLVVMAVGKIPRGKVKAPKVVQPEGTHDTASLQAHLHRTRAQLQALSDLSPRHYFTHPFLGDFRLRPALRFLGIHTRHHLHIMQDILSRDAESRRD